VENAQINLRDLSTNKKAILESLSTVVKLYKLIQLGLYNKEIETSPGTKEEFGNWYDTHPNAYDDLVKYSDQLLDKYYKKYNSIDMMLKLLEEQLVTKSGPILYKNVNPYDFKYQPTGYYF
jgi:hypothetical protein